MRNIDLLRFSLL